MPPDDTPILIRSRALRRDADRYPPMSHPTPDLPPSHDRSSPGISSTSGLSNGFHSLGQTSALLASVDSLDDLPGEAVDRLSADPQLTRTQRDEALQQRRGTSSSASTPDSNGPSQHQNHQSLHRSSYDAAFNHSNSPREREGTGTSGPNALRYSPPDAHRTAVNGASPPAHLRATSHPMGMYGATSSPNYSHGGVSGQWAPGPDGVNSLDPPSSAVIGQGNPTGKSPVSSSSSRMLPWLAVPFALNCSNDTMLIADLLVLFVLRILQQRQRRQPRTTTTRRQLVRTLRLSERIFAVQ